MSNNILIRYGVQHGSVLVALLFFLNTIDISIQLVIWSYLLMKAKLLVSHFWISKEDLKLQIEIFFVNNYTKWCKLI